MPPKRKRNDRGGPGDPDSSRPSPHRPANMNLGQHDRGYDGSRGRGGGRNPRRGGDRRDSSQSFGGPSNGPSSSAPLAPSPMTPAARRPSSSSSSAPVPIVTAASAFVAALPSAPPSPIQPGYDFSIITDERVSNWAKGARQDVINHGIQSRDDEDLIEVTTIFQELIHSVADGRLSGADAGNVVKEIMGPEPEPEDMGALAFDPHTLFLDTVSTFMDVEAGPILPQLRDFMIASEVSPSLMRIVLDPPILQALDLIRDTFVRMGIRQSTNLLYRQANYNLLREETEGFSKLVTELYTTSNAEPPSSEVVQAAFNKVMGLIGTFDLHPGRVLDVTLDVFASVLIKQFRFFIKFLRVSSWWPRTENKTSSGTFSGGLPLWALPDHFNWVTDPDEEKSLEELRLKRDIAFWERARQIKMNAFFELSGRQLTTSEEERLANGLHDGSDPSIEQDWIKITKTLPPSGNRDAAQMLGFKLRFYTSEARAPEDVLPANLLYLIALLIKVGFISLTDLWNHTWPVDEEMENVKQLRLKELEEKEKKNRPGGATNALMMAGALPDDMPPPGMSRRDAALNRTEGADPKAAADAAEDKPKLPEPDDQKVGLLRHLLTIGAIPESLFILGRYDWILQAHPDLLPLIHRILSHSIETVFQQSLPVHSAPLDCPLKKLPDPDQSGVPKGSVRLSSPVTKRALKWPFPDKADHSEGISYRFYWEEWADNVPVCQTVDDIFTLCDTLLNIAGVTIGQDAALVAKLASIGSKSLADDQSPSNVARWLDLLKRLLVPCLSLGEPNSSIAEKVWDMLKQYPIHVRYNVYAEWYEGSVSRLEPIKKAFARTRLETLSTMKRLSLTNIPQMAKTLAKTAYPSPGIVCKVALLQIESYSNLIEAFVECAKYFTDLGYDVLVWSVLSSLGGQQRSRTQETSVLLTSKWLQALSRFSGKVFQRYSNMDPTPILRYVNDQLFKGNSTDLVILKELISSMGGVVSDVDFTDAQLHAMTGGEVLRRETLISLGDKRSVSTRSADRFMKAMVNAKLAGSFLVNIAQYRQNAIYKVLDSNAHIKYLATLVDDTHLVLLQFLDLVRSNLDEDTFNRLVPGVIQLMRDFGLEAGLAFMIGRASLRSGMKNPKSIRESPKDSQTVKAAADIDGDVSMESASEEVPEKAAADEKEGRGTDNSLSKVVNALQSVIDEIPSVLPDRTWRYLSPAGYVFFWSLQLGDLSFPMESYTAETHRLGKQLEAVRKDRTDMSRAGTDQRVKKQKDIMDRQQLLIQEKIREYELFSKTKLQIIRQFPSWFPAGMAKADAASDTLLEECILPRVRLSPLDAEYCFRLVKYLHECSASNFKLMSLYERLFNHNRLRAIIFTCTVREAEHLGRFLRHVLGDLSKWHGDKNAYEKEAFGPKDSQGNKGPRLGFASAFGDDGKPTAFVEHDAFRDLLFRWHKELNTALRSCLNGLEWMHIRNAITILKSVIDFFPAINFMADKFLDQLKTITEREGAPARGGAESEHEHRVDLSVTAQTAYSELQKRKSKWILVQAFRPAKMGDNERGFSVPANSGLRASAPEFRAPAARNQSAAEVEDGEVKDSKVSRAVNGYTNSKDSLPPKQLPPAKEPLKEGPPVQKPNMASAPSGRPVTPKPAPAVPALAPGSRPDSAKSSTLPPGGHGLPSRPELPSRPDVPFPGRITTDRFGQVHHDSRREPLPVRDPREFRAPREPRDPHAPREPLAPRESRDFRAPEATRPERPREFSVADRRPLDPVREPGRPLEREWPSRPEPPPRWVDPAAASDRAAPDRALPDRAMPDRPVPDRDSRQPRERTSHSSTRHDSRPPREPAAPTPPASATSQNEVQEPLINPERARLLAEADRPPLVDPARAALINDPREAARAAPRDQGRQRAPRIESPRPSDQSVSNAAQPDIVRDDRHVRHRHSDYHGSSRDMHVDNASHPRPDRNSERERENERAPAPRDPAHDTARDTTRDTARGSDHDGRLAQQDSNYGRLNAIQSIADTPPGPPSGPRGRGRNTARINTMNGPPGRPDNRFPGPEPIRPPSPERHPPTGPSSTRPRRGQYDNVGNTNSPTATVPPATGVHPDRIRQINHQQPPPVQVGIHPDRMNQIAPVPPPAAPSSHSRPPINTPDRPAMAAPNPSSRPAPLGPSTDFATPTGPSASNDRMRPGGSRQLRGIQNTLEKASADSGRGSSGLRMSRSRTNLAGSDAQILAGSSPVTTPIHERSDPLRDGSRQDSNADRIPRGPEPIQVVTDSRDGRVEINGGDYASRGDHERTSSSRREHHRSDRSNRASRRSSRERSTERGDREPKEPREYRDRRSGAPVIAPSGGREPERDAVPPRRSMRDSTGTSRDPLPGGRDMAPPRESGHRSHRNDGPPGPRGDVLPLGRNDIHSGRSEAVGGRGGEEYSGRSSSARGTGAPRDSRSRQGDERGDPRGDDRGRKRRSEGGVDPAGSHQDKRPRR
ncbi:transcription factor/nuclear export subunit protein 2-domain-containing protein [Podospora appendiculata]|uniref:THO complex subunit 2 n=1 Tax=Podospora appendiculata TaxID=314037 RepID=A0AAE0X775_9PEZI|nr:transcription factor/nuclear export subunit protein 2-domain-containing protein [Podospora appendiculata]